MAQAPDQPEIEPLDPSTKTLKWKPLPPCKGAIVGYQLNITARREYDSDFLEVEELRVNQSVNKYLLQPWRHGTNYSVTIQGLTAAGLGQASRWDFETNFFAPGKPEIEPLDPSTKTLRWKPLLPCKGAIVGYQLNITARREYDSDFLEVEELRVNQSVTKYLLQPWRHGTNYSVTIQGLTAAGLGQASRWDFETNFFDTCRRQGPWTTNVTFPSELTVFWVNDTVLVTCPEKPEPGPFPANCTELKDRGAVWDISGVKCLRMCNDWMRHVDFDPAQTEFGVGAKGRVTCRQEFQQDSFSVTCREMESGRFEWDSGAHTCVRKCEIPRTWDSRLQFAPKRQFYSPGELVTLSCPEGHRPSPPVIVCAVTPQPPRQPEALGVGLPQRAQQSGPGESGQWVLGPGSDCSLKPRCLRAHGPAGLPCLS
nr:uncharacterized protein LOC101946296 [Chrysemys picta bellii]